MISARWSVLELFVIIWAKTQQREGAWPLACMYGPGLMFHSPTQFLMVVCLSFRYSSIHVNHLRPPLSKEIRLFSKLLAIRWRSSYQAFLYSSRFYVVPLALYSQARPHVTCRTAFALYRCNL